MPTLLVETLECADGHLIGLATLNTPATLNALTLSTIAALQEQLSAWAQEPRIVCVVLRGAGPRAFCAGGDVRALRTALIDQPHPCPHPVATQLFAQEYTLDYCIHTYTKPLIVWGHGVVMGGGLGLLVGASHRVLTPESRIAMPEISIGLFPDVGASWFLARMPARLGRFLALTGAPLCAADALLLDLGDVILEPQQWDSLLASLLSLHWPAPQAQRHSSVTAVLQHLSVEPTTAPILAHLDRIRGLMQARDLSTVSQALIHAQFDHPWLQTAQQQFIHGCPGSAALSWEIQQRCRHASLADALRLELILVLRICAGSDLSEGVRARLVDRDQQPHWSCSREQINQLWIDAHFVSPWSAEAHPLRGLGQDGCSYGM
jgi:enoyl-CoA hydratase/carnithine racemase